ncbi:LytTR family DNA-binding domain-containing protein [Pedobacter sp. Hv1]|uniref:LytR/AlgR family response regulator transcription factor n=1 Tax=Pedobacter sp. Hv1 TaxID=1740090 RepID=UPI0006D8A287|nr:LytTR family DNA-binding domain-containing protein [Pedobacter sp. Hv1]KQC01554.1 hypothetical protein AQF98_07560 [Pedobacter sp. Hv1]
MISVVIVEDSRLARKELRELLTVYPQMNVVGEADTVENAIELIESSTPDLIFLDIHLPGGSGFDVLSKLKRIPVVIFTTAFTSYALESFEYNTLDYLLKPISQDKLSRAIQKAEIFLNRDQKEGQKDKHGLNDKIFIKDRNLSWLVSFEEIRMFESQGNYIQVFFGQHRPLLQKSLQQMESSLKEGLFLKVNRKQLVNINWINQMEKLANGKLILELTTGEKVAVSRRQMNHVKLYYSFGSC